MNLNKSGSQNVKIILWFVKILFLVEIWLDEINRFNSWVQNKKKVKYDFWENKC